MVTLTGDNNYTGTYNDIVVLGGDQYGGNSWTDTTNGAETYLFGNLHYKNTDDHTLGQDVTGGTWNTTATGTSNDTLHFHFTFTPGTGGTSNFLMDGQIPMGQFGPDTDGDATYQSEANHNAWETNYQAWQAAQPIGTTYTDPVTIETKVGKTGELIITLDIQANSPSTSDSLTADHTGNKTLLGFSVDSDHIALDDVTEARFEQYFTVNASSHTSANNNTVNDTVISLGNWDNSTHTSEGNWSVDLYGVSVATLQANAASLGYSNDTKGLADYVYEHIA